MQKVFLRLLHLGQNTFWQLLQATSSASEEQLQSQLHELQQKPLHMWTGRHMSQEREQLFAHLQALGIHYTEHACAEMDHEALAKAGLEHSADTVNILCGFGETEMLLLTRESQALWYNGCSACACPWAALAEAAFIVELSQGEQAPAELDTLRMSWMGEMSPTSQSLMEAAIYVPMEYFMGIPTWSDPDHSITDMALKAGAKVFMTREPRLALDDAHIIYMDTRLEKDATEQPPVQTFPFLNDDYVWEKGFVLDTKHVGYAMKNACIVTVLPEDSYAQAHAEAQAKRKHLHRAALIITLHAILSAE